MVSYFPIGTGGSRAESSLCRSLWPLGYECLLGWIVKSLAHPPVLMAFLAASLENWSLLLKYIKVNLDTALEGALSRGVSQGLKEKTQTGLLPHISFPLEHSNLILSIAPDPLTTTTCLYILGSAGGTSSVTCHLEANDRTTGAHHRCCSHPCTPLLQAQFPAGS